MEKAAVSPELIRLYHAESEITARLRAIKSGREAGNTGALEKEQQKIWDKLRQLEGKPPYGKKPMIP